MAAVAALSLATAGSASAALVVDSTTIGQSVFVASTGNVIAKYEGADAGFVSKLYLDSPSGFSSLIFANDGSFAIGSTVDLGVFTAGTELIFRLDVTSTSKSYYTGPGSRNADGSAHAASNTTGGLTFVGFEDIDDPSGGSNGDFNDLTFSFSNTVAAPGGPGAVPEPGAWALMIAGFGGAGAALRRKRRLALA